MNKELLNELKEKLEDEKVAIKKQLATFADQDPNLKGDWDTRFPDFDGSPFLLNSNVKRSASRCKT